MVSSKFQPPRL